MIPPLKDVRTRSIRRWMQDQQPATFSALTQSGELDAQIATMDDQMMATFNERLDQVQYAMMRRPDWGTQAATQEFRMEILMLWQAVVQESLPVITDPT